MQQEIRISMKMLMYDNADYKANGECEVAITLPENLVTDGYAAEMFKLAVGSMVNDAQRKMKEAELKIEEEEEKEADENLPDLNEVERLMEDDPGEDR